MRTSKVQYRLHILNLLLFQPTVALGVFRMDVSYALLQRRLGRSFFVRVCWEWAVLLMVQGALAGVDWRRFVLYVYLPHLFAQWAIVSMNLLQHDGCDVAPAAGAERSYNTARNFTGATVNWLTFNNGFHTIHHMYPTLHWSELRRQHVARVQPHIHPNLDQASMPGYIFETFVYPGRRVDYRGRDVVFRDAPGTPDEDWVRDHAPEDMSPHAYSCGFLAGKKAPAEGADAPAAPPRPGRNGLGTWRRAWLSRPPVDDA